MAAFTQSLTATLFGTTTTGIGTQTDTDNFNRANVSPIAGNWTSFGSSADIMDISSNAVVPHNLAQDAWAIWNIWSHGDDHYSQAEITVTGSGTGVGAGVFARHSSTATTDTGYRLVLDGAGNYSVDKFVTGTPTALRTGTVSYVAGQKLGLSVTGGATTTLKVWYNNAQVGTNITDASSPITTGVPALSYSSTVTTASIDNWDAGTSGGISSIPSATLSKRPTKTLSATLLQSTGSTGVVDSYSETNQDSLSGAVSGSGGFTTRWAQCFTGDGQKIVDAKWYAAKQLSPTGNAVAKIYAMTGTFGTSGIATGSALATSDNFNVATLISTLQLVTFTFSGANQYVTTNGTKYVVSFEYTGGDASNYIALGYDASSATHPGNITYWDGVNWQAIGAGLDFCFYVDGAALSGALARKLGKSFTATLFGDAPAVPDIVNEGFEGTGTPSGWYSGGSGDWDYTASPLSGSQSLRCAANEHRLFYNGGSGFNASELWFKILFKAEALPASTEIIVEFYDPTQSNVVFQVELYSDGKLGAEQTATTTKTVDSISAGTIYNIWGHYLKGTGVNAVIEVSFDVAGNPRPNSGNKHALDNHGFGSQNAGLLFLPTGSSTSVAYVYDDVQVSSTDVFGGGSGSSATFSRRVGKALSATFSFIGNYATSLIHSGGTTFTKSVSGALSFVGSRTTRSTKSLAANLFGSSFLAKEIHRVLISTSSYIGVLNKITNKVFAAICSFVVNFVTVSSHVGTTILGLTASLVFVGNINRRTTRSFIGTSSFVGVLSRSFAYLKSLTATLWGGGSTVLDSYSETNEDSTVTLPSSFSVGQAFSSGVGGILDSCKFFVLRTGSPLANVVAQLYGTTGTLGTTAIPTGAVLAVSDPIAASGIPTTTTPITFSFSGANRVAMTASTTYCIVANYTDNSGGSINVSRDSSAPTHVGNQVREVFGGGTWLADNTFDVCFYIYVAGGATSVAVLTKRTGKSLSGVRAFVGELARQTRRSFVATLSFTGSIVSFLNHVGAFALDVTASLVFVGNLKRRTGKIFTSSVLSFSATLVKRTFRSFTATLSFIGSLVTKFPFIQLFTAVLSFTGLLTRTSPFHQLLTATLTFTGSLSKLVGQTLVATLLFVGQLSKTTYKLFGATLSFIGHLLVNFLGPWRYFIDLRPGQFKPTDTNLTTTRAESSNFRYVKTNDDG